MLVLPASAGAQPAEAKVPVAGPVSPYLPDAVRAAVNAYRQSLIEGNPIASRAVISGAPSIGHS